MRRSRLAGIAVGVGLLLAASTALAQAGGGAGVKTMEGAGSKDSGYGYEFGDDPLAAGGFGPNDATIRVRPGPVRTTLIRPRIQFVDQMLKSVENI
jgi:hypothetical protein